MGWPELIILVILAIGVLFLMNWGKKKGDDSRSARLMEKYKEMTAEEFDAIADDELVDAVVCRVLGRAAEQRRPDPVRELAALEHGSTVVYAVWAVCREMAAGDYATLTRTATWEVADLAADGFEEIGAPACAAAWRTLLTGEAADLTEAEAAFHRAVESECPLTLCVPYIRDHASEFIDTPAE